MNIPQLCFDGSLRAEKIFWLACQSDQYTDDLVEFFDERETEEIFGMPVPCNAEEAMSLLNRKGKTGFVVQVATPVPEHFTSPTDYSHSGFGYYTTKWFYTDVLGVNFMQRVLDWKKSYLQSEYRKCQPK